MDIPTTPEERQAKYNEFSRIALSTLDWAEGQMKVRGFNGAGWKMRAAHDHAETLNNHLITHGPDQIFADDPEGEACRSIISSALYSIAELKKRQ